MKGTLLILACMLLAGCANDQYTVNAGGPGSSVRLNTDLHDCKHEVLERYSHSNQAALIAAGVAGGTAALIAKPIVAGAIAGGMVGIAASQMDDRPQVTLSDINPAIEQCMADKGYTGTSEN